MDIASKGSLFGGLAQPKPIALNDKLELPDFPESGSVDFKTYLHVLNLPTKSNLVLGSNPN